MAWKPPKPQTYEFLLNCICRLPACPNIVLTYAYGLGGRGSRPDLYCITFIPYYPPDPSNIKHDSPRQVTSPARVFTYFPGSHAQLCATMLSHRAFVLLLAIPALLLLSPRSFLLFSVGFTVYYKYCYVDSSSLIIGPCAYLVPPVSFYCYV